MVKKEIKSVVKLRNVAWELRNDLMQETSHYSGYEAVMNVGKGYAEVDFMSSEDVCEIITESAFDTVMGVVSMYGMMYDGVDWHLDVARRAGTQKYYPVVRVCLKMKVK
jgi:hypothetical protein